MMYLYGFVPSDSPSPPSELAGVAGRPVDLLDLGPFSAAVSRVPDEEFDEGALEGRLRDLDWVARQGAGHERVVTWFVDRHEILPVRLLSLYSSESVLESEARAGEERIRSEMERLQGLREWDLKILYDADRLERHLGDVSGEIGAIDREMEDASPGRKYLLQRKRADASREETRKAAMRLGRELFEEAAELACQSTIVPLASDQASLPVILNAALLVEEARQDDLRGLVDERSGTLEALGLEVRFSGPWAPYRFVRGESSDTGGPSGGSSVREEKDSGGPS